MCPLANDNVFLLVLNGRQAVGQRANLALDGGDNVCGLLSTVMTESLGWQRTFVVHVDDAVHIEAASGVRVSGARASPAKVTRT